MNKKTWAAIVTFVVVALGVVAPSSAAAAVDYGPYDITNNATGQCLDADANYIGGNGTPVQLWDCYGTGQLNQIWYVYQDGYHNYTFKNKASSRVLDADANYLGMNGTPVQLWDNYGEGQTNQRWRWL